jgi:hypothetical protein
MTDNDTLADYNFKDFGKLRSAQVSCYQYPIGINSEPIGFCGDKLCLECGKNHSFRGNFKDATTFIDLLQSYFQRFSRITRAAVSVSTNCRSL